MIRIRLVITLLSLACMMSMAAFASAPVIEEQVVPTASPDYNTFIWINRILSMVYNNGNFGYDDAGILGKTDGFYYPFLHPDDDKTVIFSAGIWLGARVNSQLRVAIAEYSSEFVPGTMEEGQPSPDDPRFRVYKIGGGLDLDSIPYDDTNDWDNWPVGDGAPVDDDDDPLQLGNQMLWSVYNDADPSAHANMGTNPLGVEIQQSTFGYSESGPSQNIIFIKYVIINKGSDILDSMYVSLWADPDVGNSTDDLVGCDTILSLDYAYNDGYDTQYGMAVPAVGFDFLQGPLVESPRDTAYLPDGIYPGYRELGMSSFNKYINGTDPETPIDAYNYMRGLNRDGTPVIDPTTSDTTLFFVPGDPVMGIGWIDANSDDRRYMMSSGPFTMEPGDTQVVVVAVLATQGDNALASVTLLKELHPTAQELYYDFMDAAYKYKDNGIMPDGFSLYQNYPNPFNPSTTIEFYLDRASDVELHILNVLGQEVKTIDLGRLSYGTHSTEWDGRDNHGQRLSSGLYFYRIDVGTSTETKKMILLK